MYEQIFYFTEYPDIIQFLAFLTNCLIISNPWLNNQFFFFFIIDNLGCPPSVNGSSGDLNQLWEWILYLLKSWFLRRLLSFRIGDLDNKPFRFFTVKLNRQLYLKFDTRGLILKRLESLLIITWSTDITLFSSFRSFFFTKLSSIYSTNSQTINYL